MQRFKGSLLDVSASFGMDGVQFVNVGELCWSTTLCGGPYKLIKAGTLLSLKEGSVFMSLLAGALFDVFKGEALPQP
ncbi:hypothetical protein QL285_045543 [Trifolium repens]|nr:hypothetical protein QL285_045543 [Trifolium repens]